MSSQPPPYGALIEKAREDAGLSYREAARRADISDAWWRYVVTGRQGGNPVRGSAEVVAAMARVVGVDPDRLAGEGERPDAADRLRDLLEDESGEQSAEAPGPEEEHPLLAEPGPGTGSARNKRAWILFPGRDRLSALKRAVYRDPESSEEEIFEYIGMINRMAEAGGPDAPAALDGSAPRSRPGSGCGPRRTESALPAAARQPARSRSFAIAPGTVARDANAPAFAGKPPEPLERLSDQA